MTRDNEAITRTVEAAIQAANLATLVEVQAKRICQVRGVAEQWTTLALIAVDLRRVADELKAAAGAGTLGMSEGWLGALDPMARGCASSGPPPPTPPPPPMCPADDCARRMVEEHGVLTCECGVSAADEGT